MKFADHAALSQREQPWECLVFDQFAELSVDSNFAEADDRAATIHCGAALQHFKLALKRHGCLGRIDFFPDLERPWLAARIHTGCCGGHEPLDQQLFDTATLAADTLTIGNEDAVGLLFQTGANDRSWLELARSETNQQRLRELLRKPDRLQVHEMQMYGTTLTRSSGRSWDSYDSPKPSLRGSFPRWRKPALAVKVQPKHWPGQASPEAWESPLANGTLAVLKTKTDDKHGWLAAGSELARLLLRARSLGLDCRHYLAPLQSAERRNELRTTIGHKGFTQAILHLAMPRIELPASAPNLISLTETATAS